METFDVVVIGGGPGGYPAAIRAAQLGASVALVEKEMLGGTCLNWGCIPTKTLIASSTLFDQIRHADAFGIRVKDASFQYPAMAKRKNAVVQTLRGGVEQLLKANGVTVKQGTASFVARDKLAVASGKKSETIGAQRTIIATGSCSAMPGFIPRSDRIMESRAFLDLQQLPASLIVLGGGVIGCEFACMAAQFGVAVTIVEMLDDILMILDPDVRRELRRHMEKTLKIRILTGTPMEDIRAEKDRVLGTVGEETVDAEMMLVSVGRRPVVDGLDLDKVGIDTVNGGFIPTDAYGRTRAASIFAVGDVVEGTTQLAHEATSQGITAAENAVGNKPKKCETLVPACIFTAPEVAAVGLTETLAKAEGREITVGKFPFTALGKALAIGETDGFVKWIADAESDQLLGAHAVGPHATDLIAEAAAAIRSELTAAELGRTIHCHPTLSEAWMEAAHAVHGTCVHAAPARRKR